MNGLAEGPVRGALQKQIGVGPTKGLTPSARPLPGVDQRSGMFTLRAMPEGP